MPVRGNTFKIFVGNLSDRTKSQDLRELFEKYGNVLEADTVEGKSFGFVHMETEEQRKDAVEALNGHTLHDKEIAVEASTGNSKKGNKRTKIFVGNLHKDTTTKEIRDLFEAHGTVNEADIVNNFAFVHMDSEDDARNAVESLDGTELHGLRLRVQESTSRVRQSAGMGNSDSCYRCGSRGHFSRDCRSGDGGRRGGRYGGDRYDPYGGPPSRGFDRDRMMRSMRDDRYSPYADDPYYRRPLPPLRDDPYDRRPLPPLRGDPYDRRPLPPLRDDPYDRRPMRDDPYARRLPPVGMDYMSYGRRSRSPPPRYGRSPPRLGRSPPPSIARYPPPPPRRPF